MRPRGAAPAIIFYKPAAMSIPFVTANAVEMSALLPLPALQCVEGRVDIRRLVTYHRTTWTVSLYTTVIYLFLIFQGRRWMQKRDPYALKKPLFLWNVGLAVFSILGTSSCLPIVLYTLFEHGVNYSVCFSEVMDIPSTVLWTYLFALSKLLELGDTAFIILRKTPLPFLHWYHHVTVLIYTMYGMTDPNYNAVGTIFCGMNYFVHSLMYSYYACRALGVHIPRWVAQVITTLQLSQMFVGVSVTVLAFYNDRSGRVPGCTVRNDFIYLAAGMYFSYSLLFLHFFYKRYCSSKNQSKIH